MVSRLRRHVAVRVAYAVGVPLGEGIGLTAEMGIAGLQKAGVLRGFVQRQPNVPEGDEAFDRWAANLLRHFDGWDTVVAWNHMGLETLEMAKEMGAKSVVIRASTHPSHQQAVLAEEAVLLGGGRGVPAAVVERCEKEFELADAILIPSEYVKKTMVSRGVPESKLKLVSHGVDLDRFTMPMTREAPFRVCYTGPNIFRKGGTYLAQAMKLVPESILEAPGLTGPMVPDVAALYRRSHAYCLPTLEEGQALGVLEAAASGCAIVTTEASGALDILKDGVSCLVVRPRNIQDIADALNLLRKDQEFCRKIGEAARKAVEPFTWGRYGEGLVKACEEAGNQP